MPDGICHYHIVTTALVRAKKRIREFAVGRSALLPRQSQSTRELVQPSRNSKQSLYGTISLLSSEETQKPARSWERNFTVIRGHILAKQNHVSIITLFRILIGTHPDISK